MLIRWTGFVKIKLTIYIGLVDSHRPENQQLVEECPRLDVGLIGQCSTQEETVYDADNGEPNRGGRVKMAANTDGI